MLGTSERTALQQLTREELPGLYSLARRLGGVGGADPGDLVQDALVRACRSFPSLQDRRAGCAWLRTILTNVWRDGLRKDGRTPDHVTFDDEERVARHHSRDESVPRPYAETLHVELLGAFSEADVHLVLDRLPPRYRAPLVLRYLAGFSVQEIAALLDLPKGTTVSRLHRGRERFERELGSYARESRSTGDGNRGGRCARGR
ncbi:MAG TPA: sigma-70 family RNA polymerase sigma factor [Acidimicrobiales bacterium]|nr:sigma-70 family RNA polymerase sigma factor [Acidimicrobiales bacterium]